MKRFQITLPFIVLLLGLFLYIVSIRKIHASTATSGSFRIDKPQVVIQEGTHSQGAVNIEQRSSPQDALEFQKTGVLIQRAVDSSLKATVGMQLIEIGENINGDLKIPMYASGKTNYEYIHVRRNSNLSRSIIYSLLQKIDDTGTIDSVNITIPQDLSKKKAFLGTLEIIVGAY